MNILLNSTEGQDSKQTAHGFGFSFVFHAYVKHFPAEAVDVNLPVAAAGGQSDQAPQRRVHAIFVCCAGALLGVAKHVAVLKQEADASTQARALTELFPEYAAAVKAKKDKDFEWQTKPSLLRNRRSLFQVAAEFDTVYDLATKSAGLRHPELL